MDSIIVWSGWICAAMLLMGLCFAAAKGDAMESGQNDDKAEPLKSRKMLQVGLIVRDVEKSAAQWAELFGMDKPEIIISEPLEKAQTQYRGKPTEARVKQAFFNFENIQVELLEPVGDPSTWKDFLDANGNGVHHIAFEVKGMDDEIEKLDNNGVDLIQYGRWTTGSGGSYAYMDSEKQLGVILELLEIY
ncbi:MAG: VOC family protein [Sedimentisphaerales bacterium]|nr:VOC family protein [Sedimentisphaerales bacterium]